MKNVLEWVRDIAIAVIIAAIILVFFKPIIVKQSSMEPTFYANNYVIISRQAYTIFGDYDHGDVVVFKSDLYDEEGNQKNLIKRIIGLPGDVIEITDGEVYRNGELLKEDYLLETQMSGEMTPVTVPEGTLFVMGDNRRVSQDSRAASVGCVDEDHVMGKVVLRLYPFNKIRTF